MDRPALSAFPERLTLELTNECNYRCVMCPSRIKPDEPRGVMDPALFRRIVDQAAEHPPVALVPFFRGESLLHPDLISLLTHARTKGLGPIQLATNAALLDEETARGLLDVPLDFISFSLDTIDPEEYAGLRQGGSLDRVQRNVFRLLELRERGRFPTQVQVSATRVAANAQSIDRFIDFWRDRVDRTRIYYEHSSDGHTGSLDCPEVPKDMARRPCHKLYSDMVVYFDGRVAACNHDWFRAEPLGDLTRASVAEVWLGPAYENLRDQHLAPDRMADPTCLYCDHWKVGYLDPPFVGELYTPNAPRKKIRAASG